MSIVSGPVVPLDAELERLRDQVHAAAADRHGLEIVGGRSKTFFGESVVGRPLPVAGYRGIVAYEPSELVVTARCGTPLIELEATLAERRQMLGFEPPHFPAAPSDGAQPAGIDGGTIGGCVAAGLSGPRRISAGALRDFVLGVKLLDARGELLKFGGQVMKNVAGYDVSRLLAGSLGILGVITEVSLKVLPVPQHELTVRLSLSQPQAIELFAAWAGQALPISATYWHDDEARVRLSGAQPAVDAARARIGGQLLDAETARSFWRALNDQQLSFFSERAGAPLWRISVPSTTAMLDSGCMIENGGATRWVVSHELADRLRARVAALGGTATLFRAADKTAGVFHPLTGLNRELNERIKRAFDPNALFNRGRMFKDL